jgi:DNA polymerase-3 subunit delta
LGHRFGVVIAASVNPMVSKPQPRVLLVYGEDEYTVKLRARDVFRAWSEEIGGTDHETVDASASNADEALKTLNRLREALDTLPFFGPGKVVWFRDCTFLGEDRTAGTVAVTERLAELVPFLQSFPWGAVRLLVSAGKVDKRRAFYKTFEKIGGVEHFAELTLGSSDWVDRMSETAERAFADAGKGIDSKTLSDFVAMVGPNLRQLHQEIEKLQLFVGDRQQIEINDLNAVVSRNRQARAFALGDALGERNVPALLKALGEELWEMQFDRKKSEIGVLYGLISKVRVMLLAKELMREGWLKQERDFNRFKAQLSRLADKPLPNDKKYNPRLINPFVLFRAAQQSRHYSTEELVAAMDRLLACNQQLVGSNLDESLVLQRAVVGIAGISSAPGPAQGSPS